MAWNTIPSSRRCSSSGRFMHTPNRCGIHFSSATSPSTRAIWSSVQVRYEMLQPRALLDRAQRPTEDTSRSDRGGAASGPPREGQRSTNWRRGCYRRSRCGAARSPGRASPGSRPSGRGRLVGERGAAGARRRPRRPARARRPRRNVPPGDRAGLRGAHTRRSVRARPARCHAVAKTAAQRAITRHSTRLGAPLSARIRPNGGRGALRGGHTDFGLETRLGV